MSNFAAMLMKCKTIRMQNKKNISEYGLAENNNNCLRNRAAS